MAQQEGFEIYNRFYPSPQRFRMGDPVLVREVTGLEWPQFAIGLDQQAEELSSLIEQGREDEFEADQVLTLGLLAVAFWHGNQQMSRAKVVKAVERIPIEEVKYIAGDEEVDVDPPAEAAGLPPSTTSRRSDNSPEGDHPMETPLDSISDATSPNGSGSPGSLSPHPESLPA